jgi:thiamine-monophosphate kinase
MSIADYDRFLQGLSDAAVEIECPVVGGNIREGRKFAAVGTAIGYCPPDAVLVRSGARSGDIVAVVGTMGVFWADVLSELNNLVIPNEYSDLASQVMKHPTPKIGPGVSFAREHLITSCIDTSDGVSAILVTLSTESKTDIKVHLDALSPHPFVEKTACRLGYDPL